MKSSHGIQPSLVKQYIYCPVIPWIISKYCIVEPVSDSMVLGREKHDQEKQVRVRGKYGVAVIDEITEDREGRVIVEKKIFRSRSIHRYIVQAITQYILASGKIKCIRKIIVENGGYKHVIRITDDLVDEVKKVIDKYLEIIERDDPPKTIMDKKKCSICWYRRFCPYH